MRQMLVISRAASRAALSAELFPLETKEESSAELYKE